MAFKIGPMAYISRMDYERNAHGWWVKFVRSGEYLAQKSFKDSAHNGNKSKSLMEATKWRDKTLKLLKEKYGFEPMFAGHRIPPFLKKRRGTLPGRVGIMKVDHYCLRKTTNLVIHNYAWKATWVQYVVEKGKVIRKQTFRTFSIHKYGDRPAFFKAQTARRDAEKFLMTPYQTRLRNEYKNNRITKKGSDSNRKTNRRW